MEFSASQPSAGWYPDPAGTGDERYWDGEAWSQVTRPNSRSGMAARPATVRHPAQLPAEGAPQLAGWWRRAVASIVDCVILFLPYVWLMNMLAGEAFIALASWWETVLLAAQTGGPVPDISDAVMMELGTAGLILRLLAVLYRTLFLSAWGATPGKMILGIRVVPVTEPTARRPRWPRALGRELAVEMMNYFIVPLLITYLMPLFNPRNQTLHDMAAGTVVVLK